MCPQKPPSFETAASHLTVETELYLMARAFAMSTNSTSTSVSTNSTQVRQTASTRFSPLLHNGDSFRLLRVLPSLSHGFSIRCKLYTSSISRERDKYIAGSYVWGPPEPKKTILVDGEHFQVRENLFRFLKAFRSRYQSQAIWLDAICIDQDDIEERSHQVQEMKRIYSGAKCVYSWLGSDKPLPRRRDQLEYIFQAEYWSRMWIVQEFILANEVQLLVGRNRLPYSKLENLHENRPSFNESTVIPRSKAFDFMFYRNEPKTFETLFANFGMLPRSVPVDGVFALLGLLKGTEKDLRLISIADYSLTVWQLLQQIFALDILQYPFRFAEQYNRYVIKGQRDDYMGGDVGLELMERPPPQLSGADDSWYGRTEGSSLEMAMGIQTSRAIRHYVAFNENIFEVAMYTPRYRTISGQSGVSIGLSWCSVQPASRKFLRTNVLVEACDSRCTTTCATHAVVGFSWTISHGHEHEHTRDPAPTTSINVPLLISYALGDVSQLIHNIQKRSTEMVEATGSKVRMNANDGVDSYTGRTPYKLETDVETMVILSTFIKDFETHNGWQGLLALAMDWLPKSGTEDDAKRPKKRRRQRKHVSQKRGKTRAD